MTTTPTRPIVVTSLAGVLIASLSGVFDASQGAPASQTSEPQIQLATIKQYCAGCHNDRAKTAGVTIAFETGQETADLLRLTLDELRCPNLKVNFDPANMLLYDKGDPIRAVEILGPDIRSVHVKDANRPTTPGQWGEEVPLGQGQVNIRQFVKTLKKVGYRGPLCIEREVGNQEERLKDLAHGIRYLRECLAA